MDIKKDKHVCEVVRLSIIDGKKEEFLSSFTKARQLLSKQKGHISHEILESHDDDNQYLLIIRWTTIEAHQEGFRKSSDYVVWSKLLHKFYDPFPEVEYFSPTKQ